MRWVLPLMRRVGPALVAVLVVLPLAASFALASSPRIPIDACYAPQTGAVRLVHPVATGAAAALCNKDEQLFTWSRRHDPHWTPWTHRASGVGVGIASR